HVGPGGRHRERADAGQCVLGLEGLASGIEVFEPPASPAPADAGPLVRDVAESRLPGRLLGVVGRSFQDGGLGCHGAPLVPSDRAAASGGLRDIPAPRRWDNGDSMEWTRTDEAMMARALAEAKACLAWGDVPIG